MELQKLRLVTALAVVCASGPGCSSLKKLNSSDETIKTSVTGDLEVADTDSMNPMEKRISLLNAKASLAEMDNLHSEAIESYESILEIDPGNVVALHRLALLHIQQSNYEDAEQKFQAALRGVSDNAMVHNDYGYFCHLQNRPEEAKLHLTKAVELDPKYLTAHNNLGLVLAGDGQRESAERHFHAAKCNEAQTLNNLALARFMNSDIGDARKLYDEALRIDPNQAQARKSLAAISRLGLAAETNRPTSIAPASFHAVDDSPME